VTERVTGPAAPTGWCKFSKVRFPLDPLNYVAGELPGLRSILMWLRVEEANASSAVVERLLRQSAPHCETVIPPGYPWRGDGRQNSAAIMTWRSQ
jgi:hypothetical protein